MPLIFSGKQDVYIEIAEKYKEYIRLGILKDGDKLPSVREAATDLSVKPNTVARAYAKLEEEGYVKALPKKGAFVTYGGQRQDSEKKRIIRELRDMGVDKATLYKWIEEVYGEND